MAKQPDNLRVLLERCLKDIHNFINISKNRPLLLEDDTALIISIENAEILKIAIEDFLKYEVPSRLERTKKRRG